MTAKQPLIDQPTARPTRKVTAGALGGSAGAIVAWAVVSLLTKNVVPLPPEIAAEVYALAAGLASAAFGTVAAYFTRERAPDPTPRPHDGRR